MGIRRLLHTLRVGREHGVRARLRRRSAASAPEDGGAVRAVPPEGLVPVARSEELRDGEVIEVRAGEALLALARVDGIPRAVSAVCPHAGGALGDGGVEGAILTCPLHGWRFDLRTGRCLVDPDRPVAVHRVVEQGGTIYASPTPER